MPRFFFHVRDNSSAFDDPEGEYLREPADAAIKAEQIARELAGDGDSYHSYQVIALDEAGDEVANCRVGAYASSAYPERESGGRLDLSAATACQPRVVRRVTGTTEQNLA